MSNRTDFNNQAAEFLAWMRSAPADEIQRRLERELNDAFVAGQEHENADLRTALAEALNIAELANGSANGFSPEREARIDDLRARFLGDGFVKCAICGAQGTEPSMKRTMVGHVCPICDMQYHKP